jgi:hypothetical protein
MVSVSGPHPQQILPSVCFATFQRATQSKQLIQIRFFWSRKKHLLGSGDQIERAISGAENLLWNFAPNHVLPMTS